MAAPAIALAVKAAIAAATDKRTWKAAGILIAAILTPVILAIVMILSLLSGTSQHNNAAVDLCFNGGAFSSSAPAEYTAHIEDMRNCFSALDQAISSVDAKMDGGTLDSVQIKSIFYALNFGADHLSLSSAEARSFVDCFVRYEERTKTVKDEATGEEKTETETVAVPVNLDTAYANLSTSGILANGNDRTNAQKIYEKVACGEAGSYSGGIERGGGSGIALDGLTLLHPETKNNLDLVIYAKNAYDSGWGYVWGTYGDVLTDSLFASKLKQYPDGVGSYADFIRENWLGGRTTDCVGLIKGYGWFNPDTKAIEYGTNGMKDVGADGIRAFLTDCAQKLETAVASGKVMPKNTGIAVDSLECMAAGSLLLLKDLCRQMERPVTAEQLVCRLRSEYKPHEDRGWLRSRMEDIRRDLADIGRQIDTPGIRSEDDMRQLCRSYLNLALDCVKARMFMELESPELIPEQEQAVNFTMSM